ncbi:MAG: cytochrome c maturation protein CcmE [Chloroflexi bacterium]|nr:cytochrome c maturation protein CcmE [Chloroflexota bacterium]
MLKKKKFIIGGIILLVALGYLGFTGFMGAATYYYKVSELVALGDSGYDQSVRVNGKVVPGSVVKEAQGRILKFTVADEAASLPVYYEGIVPDTFKEDVEIVVEGKLTSNGVFQAKTLLPKCPSRYEAAPEQ